MDEPLDPTDCPRHQVASTSSRTLAGSSSPERVRPRRDPPQKPYASPPRTRPRSTTSSRVKEKLREGVAEEWSPVVQTPADVDLPPPALEFARPVRERPVCVVRGAVYIEDYIEIPSPVNAGETVTSTTTATTVGGRGVLQAVAISRAGQRVEMVSAIGPDGESIPPFLTAQGVGNSGVKVPEAGEQTLSLLSGRTIHQYTSSNPNPGTILIPGTSSHPTLDSLPPSIALRSPVSHLVVGNELPAQRTCAYVDEAYERGITTILNPAPMRMHTEPTRHDPSSPYTLATLVRDFPWHKISYLVLDAYDAAALVRTLEERKVRLCPPRVGVEDDADGEGGDSAGERSPTQDFFPSIAIDERLEAGLIPPVPKKHLKTLRALISWPPIFHVGIVLCISPKFSSRKGAGNTGTGGNEDFPGVLAVLPAARGVKSKIFWEPAPPEPISRIILSEFLHQATLQATTTTHFHGDGGGSLRTGSLDTALGYFVAGLMEFALFDRMDLDEVAWRSILEKAVMASHLTPRTFPPTPPLPIYSIPHFPTVHAAVDYVRKSYTQQRLAGTSVRPFRAGSGSGSSGSPLPLETIESMESWDGGASAVVGASSPAKGKGVQSPDWSTASTSSGILAEPISPPQGALAPLASTSRHRPNLNPYPSPETLMSPPPLAPAHTSASSLMHLGATPSTTTLMSVSSPALLQVPQDARIDSPPLEPPALVPASSIIFAARRAVSALPEEVIHGYRPQPQHYHGQRHFQGPEPHQIDAPPQHPQHPHPQRPLSRKRRMSHTENPYPSLHALSSPEQHPHSRSPRASGSSSVSSLNLSLSPPLHEHAFTSNPAFSPLVHHTSRQVILSGSESSGSRMAHDAQSRTTQSHSLSPLPPPASALPLSASVSPPTIHSGDNSHEREREHRHHYGYDPRQHHHHSQGDYERYRNDSLMHAPRFQPLPSSVSPSSFRVPRGSERDRDDNRRSTVSMSVDLHVEAGIDIRRDAVSSLVPAVGVHTSVVEEQRESIARERPRVLRRYTHEPYDREHYHHHEHTQAGARSYENIQQHRPGGRQTRERGLSIGSRSSDSGSGRDGYRSGRLSPPPSHPPPSLSSLRATSSMQTRGKARAQARPYPLISPVRTSSSRIWERTLEQSEEASASRGGDDEGSMVVEGTYSYPRSHARAGGMREEVSRSSSVQRVSERPLEVEDDRLHQIGDVQHAEVAHGVHTRYDETEEVSAPGLYVQDSMSVDVHTEGSPRTGYNTPSAAKPVERRLSVRTSARIHRRGQGQASGGRKGSSRGSGSGSGASASGGSDGKAGKGSAGALEAMPNSPPSTHSSRSSIRTSTPSGSASQ